MKFNMFQRTSEKVFNHEGAERYVMNELIELCSALVTTGLSDKFLGVGRHSAGLQAKDFRWYKEAEAPFCPDSIGSYILNTLDI